MKVSNKFIVLCSCIALAVTSMPQRLNAAGSLKNDTSVTGGAISLEQCLSNSDNFEIVKKMLRPDMYNHEESTEESTEETSEIESTTEDESTETDSTEETTEETTTEETPAETAPPFTGTYIVAATDNYINVRETPNEMTGTVLGKMYTGAIGYADGIVEGTNGLWYHMSSGTVTGYVKAEFFLTGADADNYMAGNVQVIGIVNDNAVNLNIRSGPSVKTASYGLIARGTQMSIIGEEGDFYKIEVDAGCIGYLHKDYINITKVYKQAISLTEERIQAEEAYEREQASIKASEEEAIAQSQEQSRQESEAASIAESVWASSVAESVYQSSVAQSAYDASVAESIQASIAADQQTAATETQPVETQPVETQPVETQPVVTETAGKTVTGIQATYIGGKKYTGQTVSSSDISVIATYNDGTVEQIVGWTCGEVGNQYPAGSHLFTVFYGDYLSQFYMEFAEPETTAAPEPQPLPSGTRGDIVTYALQFVGNPYVYGGTSLTNGTDCSGFTMRVYEHFGIAITRTSRSQAVASNAREIGIYDVQPGDLLFYWDYSAGQIGHVALYIGNGQIVHAANESVGIIVSDAYYREPCKAVTFLG